MADFNYSKYVADMAQRTGPMFENNDAEQLGNSGLDQLSLPASINEEDLKEYEVIYVVQNGRCYRITDEGYKDEVSMDKCRMYAEGVDEALRAGVYDDFTKWKESFPNGTEFENKNGYVYALDKDKEELGKWNPIKMKGMHTDDFQYKSLEEKEMDEAIDDTDVEVTDDEFDSAEFDKEPSKKDIKAAEKEFSLEVPKADSSADSAFEKAKQVIKIKVGKLLAQPKGKRTMSPDMAALKQFIQKPEIKKAFKSRGLDVMDFVKDVIA